MRLVGDDRNRDAAEDRDDLGVGHPVRRLDDHLVARVDQGGEGVEDGLLAAVGDQHLVGVDRDAGVAQRLGGDRLPQRGQARRRGVAVPAGVAACLRRPPRRCSRGSGSRARRRRNR